MTPNPFLDARVGTAWEQPKADLPGFNDASYQNCLRTIEEARAAGKSFSLVVHGEAGSGKTHLLAKLRRRCAQDENVIFAATRLDCAPSMIWRHFRKQLVESLAQGTPPMIERLALEDASRMQPANLRRAWAHLAEGTYRFDALDWLRGDPIPASMLEKMGMGASVEFEEGAESEAEEIVRSLAKLIAPRVLVFCLDQVEAIQSHPGDHAALFQLGQAGAGLVDKCDNICLILCAQTSFVNELEQGLREADRHRILMRRTGLDRLTREQARELARLRQQGIAGVTPAWPVDETKLIASMPKGDEVIRKVLFSAARLFDEGITGEAPPRQTREQCTAAAFEEEQQRAEGLVTSTLADHVLRDGLPLLLYQAGWTKGQNTVKIPEPVLVHERDQARRYVVLMNETHSTSLANKMRKLIATRQPMKDFVVMRDASLGISTGARATRQYLEEFEGLGGKFVQVSREALVALEAMRKLLSSAESGDLAHEGEALGEEFVAQWLKERMPESLVDLLAEIDSPRPRARDHLETITAHLAKVKVASAESIAEATGLSLGVIEDCARHHPQQLVWFGGTTPAIARGAVG